MRADPRKRDDAVGGACLLVELTRSEPDEQDLVQPRAVADDLAAGIHGVRQEWRLAGRQILESDDLPLPIAGREHEAIAGLGALLPGIARLGGGMARRAEKHPGAKGGPQERTTWASETPGHRSQPPRLLRRRRRTVKRP